MLNLMDKTGFRCQIPEEVIKRAIKGDICAFENIYNTFINASYNLAYRVTYNATSAEDITQEAYLKIFKRIHTYDFKGSFAGWIRRIVVNESINHMKSKHQLNILLDNEIVNNQSSNLFETEWLINSLELDSYLKKLPTISRLVMLLHEVEGYKHKEIASIFDKSESFSKMTLKRAFNELHQLLKSEEKKYALK